MGSEHILAKFAWTLSHHDSLLSKQTNLVQQLTHGESFSAPYSASCLPSWTPFGFRTSGALCILSVPNGPGKESD